MPSIEQATMVSSKLAFRTADAASLKPQPTSRAVSSSPLENVSGTICRLKLIIQRPRQVVECVSNMFWPIWVPVL